MPQGTYERPADFSRRAFAMAAGNSSTDEQAAARARVSLLTFRLRCREFGIQTPAEREAQVRQLLGQPPSARHQSTQQRFAFKPHNRLP